MQSFRRRLACAVVFGLALNGTASAQEAPAAPAIPAPQVPATPEPEPSPGQMAAARDVIVASGMARSFIPMVPQLSEQIGPMLTRTRPDLTKDLTAVLDQLKPEFEKKTDEMIDIAARIFARRMSEDDLKQTAAFFNSPVGKKYVDLQPVVLDELVVSMQSWTQQLSNFMMQRVRDEMSKKGHKF